MWFEEFTTPVGRLTVAAEDDGIRHILFEKDKYGVADRRSWRRDASSLREARDQILAYFAGERKAFDLPLCPDGTPFQRRVWTALCEIAATGA
jgi:methylated-DNA-[protein]-cysteine S-methyltransferase